MTIGLRVKPQPAFDICHATYEELISLHGWRIPSSTPNGDDACRAEETSGRPHFLPTLGDYLSDFARCGERVLRPSRLILFRMYYLGGGDYERVRQRIGISPEGWAVWTEEIRRKVGQELLECGVFPPGRYFREPMLNHATPRPEVVSCPTQLDDSPCTDLPTMKPPSTLTSYAQPGNSS